MPDALALRIEDGKEVSLHHFDSVLGGFIAGHLVSISGDRGSRSILKRMAGSDYVWCLAVRTPRPGWRILGRFAMRDTFIALSLADRGAVAGPAYKAAVEAVVSDWDSCFPGVAPVRDWSAAACLSLPFEDLDHHDDET